MTMKLHDMISKTLRNRCHDGISQILSLLEKHDFVKRKEHSRDTRAKVVILKQKEERRNITNSCSVN